jgi:serine/threonine protein kinase
MTIIPLRYAAPELLRNTTSLNYSEKSDIFSMGVLMWEACSYGELPYSSLEIDDDVLREKLNDRRLSRPKLCSDQQWTIINECWHQNPGDRPDFERLKKRLKPISSNLDKRKLSFCD